MKKSILSMVSFALVFNVTTIAQNTTFKIVNTFHIQGDGGWDYIAVDEETGRLFVSHGMVTQVVDSKNGNLISTIEDTKGVHGIALAPDMNKAFISCGKDSTV